MRPAALCLLLLLTGCTPAGAAPAAATSAAPPAPPASAPLARWSRDKLAPPIVAADSASPAVITTVDPGALDELLAAAPKAPRAPTGADGGTRLGSDTGVPAPTSSAKAPPPEPPRAAHVTMGKPEFQTQIANPALERAARAQFYWSLVQRCRDPEGKILPPDAIRLRFTIDVEGYIDASSINTTPSNPRYAEAAYCMRRELATAAFRAPASTRGQPGLIDATVPSVD